MDKNELNLIEESPSFLNAQSVILNLKHRIHGCKYIKCMEISTRLIIYLSTRKN